MRILPHAAVFVLPHSDRSTSRLYVTDPRHGSTLLHQNFHPKPRFHTLPMRPNPADVATVSIYRTRRSCNDCYATTLRLLLESRHRP